VGKRGTGRIVESFIRLGHYDTNTHSEIWNLESGIWNLESGIRNQETEQSEVHEFL